MAFFKCKMCGGELELAEGAKICECDFCGTRQTVPSSMDENIQTIFNRANTLRIKCEFDKAERLYEKIIASDETQAEAYWGLILCKYGIEYVEDPQTFKRVPTCHRASFDSVVGDDDYKSALEFADAAQKAIYEQEAREIDRIQKEILALAQNEERYDVFICYKETDSSGARTQDSVIANDIYHQLTNEGLKVFYAAITLEDKLGKSYEPCIFAALNSAKVMLVIGTKLEYFSAVWVKNEWSRFLKIMAKDRSKLLIPCYRDMDAYELPEEFAHLQAQDMSKIGFINDVVRGIKKVTTPEVKQESTPQTTVVENANGNLTALLDRGFMALEDGEWEKADDFFEKVLNFDAKLAEAYLGKLMAELRVKTRSDLGKCEKTFEGNSNYQKVIRFGNDAIKAEVEGYISCIVEKKKAETYSRAVHLMENDDIDSYEKAAELFETILDYKDAKELKGKCLEDGIENFKKLIGEYSARAAQTYVSARGLCTMGIKKDGTVVATRYSLPQYMIDYDHCKVSEWKNIIAISTGYLHTVGLRDNGTVVAIGRNEKGECNVSSWRDIVAISTGPMYTVGLKADGTVVAVGDNSHGECNVSGWCDIVAISAGGSHAVGLKSNGTVVATGSNASISKLSSWRSIVAISATMSSTIGLKADGTVVDTRNSSDVSSWSDIVAISGLYHKVGLKADGTVVAVGSNSEGQCNVSSWRDIVAISAGTNYTVGLKSDGTVVAVGSDEYKACSVGAWRGIQRPIQASSIEELKEKRKELAIQMAKEREERERLKKEKLERERKLKEERRNAGVCQHCGGELKGFLFKKCVACGKSKDY